MFTPDFYIDLVQSTKRQFTDKVYQDPILNQAAHNYINAQSAFAKMLAKNYIDLSTYSVDSISKILFPKKDETVKVKTTKKTTTDINTQGE